MLYYANIQKICTKYARNISNYAYHMQLYGIIIYAIEMQLCKKYAKKNSRNYIDCNNVTVLVKYAKDMHKIYQKYA